MHPHRIINVGIPVALVLLVDDVVALHLRLIHRILLMPTPERHYVRIRPQNLAQIDKEESKVYVTCG